MLVGAKLRDGRGLATVRTCEERRYRRPLIAASPTPTLSAKLCGCTQTKAYLRVGIDRRAETSVVASGDLGELADATRCAGADQIYAPP